MSEVQTSRIICLHVSILLMPNALQSAACCYNLAAEI